MKAIEFEGKAVTNSLAVDATSRIDASGRGYPANVTLGTTTTNASSGFSGGSYGGLGQAGGGGQPNAVYGDYHNPVYPGAGGANNGYGGGGAAADLSASPPAPHRLTAEFWPTAGRLTSAVPAAAAAST